ncbi:entericidin A/B family lipoprotein [Coraliomargarita sp. SDUM461004]|uniref:Entericidin A/B family lipoprotein n=1 Tax=Thalassobacterium sedimentorum TaxID=3041258 RepID=A0ABU1AK64_9BACT|nr:entericidin A/B family lipoprotein [Coraliomargarita sp. SDUM461004]MDQ8195207.1 entericidin A/B family lipoprotein [Coraliomargarita sp. SDUM461004]
MKKLISLLVTLGVLLAMTACNTVDGLGEDIEDAGESMQDASN